MIIVKRAGGTYKWTKIGNRACWAWFCVHHGMEWDNGVVEVEVVCCQWSCWWCWCIVISNFKKRGGGGVPCPLLPSLLTGRAAVLVVSLSLSLWGGDE